MQCVSYDYYAFCEEDRFEQFSEFKVLLRWELDNIQVADSHAYERACNSIIRDMESLKNGNFDALCKLLYESKRAYVYGSGDIQNAVAKQMKRMFLSCQEIVFDFGGVTFDKTFYTMVKPEDLVFLISLSGESKEIVEIAKNLKAKGVKIISITEFNNNTVANLSDESLYISAVTLDILDEHPTYKITMMYFILIELFFIQYSIYKKNRMLAESSKLIDAGED